jgi:hypothetical protein
MENQSVPYKLNKFFKTFTPYKVVHDSVIVCPRTFENHYHIMIDHDVLIMSDYFKDLSMGIIYNDLIEIINYIFTPDELKNVYGCYLIGKEVIVKYDTKIPLYLNKDER